MGSNPTRPTSGSLTATAPSGSFRSCCCQSRKNLRNAAMLSAAGMSPVSNLARDSNMFDRGQHDRTQGRSVQHMGVRDRCHSAGPVRKRRRSLGPLLDRKRARSLRPASSSSAKVGRAMLAADGKFGRESSARSTRTSSVPVTTSRQKVSPSRISRTVQPLSVAPSYGHRGLRKLSHARRG